MMTYSSFVLCGTMAPWQFILIAFIVLLLFGGKKIPELMRGLGKGVKSFKDGMNDVEKEVTNTTNSTTDKKDTSLPK